MPPAFFAAFFAIAELRIALRTVVRSLSHVPASNFWRPNKYGHRVYFARFPQTSNL